MKQKRKLLDELMEGVDAMQQQRGERSPCVPMRSRTCHLLKWTLNSFDIPASACTSPAPWLPAALARGLLGPAVLPANGICDSAQSSDGYRR